MCSCFAAVSFSVLVMSFYLIARKRISKQFIVVTCERYGIHQLFCCELKVHFADNTVVVSPS